MSAEMIITIATFVGILATFAAGFGWLLHRIDAVENKLSARIDSIDDKLSARIDNVHAEVTELKIAVARWEGPRPNFAATR